jgi:uncharacterized membrane protein YphA (DoxX/SURF4 family)
MEKQIEVIKQFKIIQLFTVLLRYLLGGAFVYASIFKIYGIRFTPKSAENAPIDSLNHLLETMYRSEYFWQFIGWGQLAVGLLLMTQIFATLGAVMYFPMILSIFIITLSFDSSGILLTTWLMTLANIYLLLWDWNKLKFVVLPNPSRFNTQSISLINKRIWVFIGIFLFLTIVVIRVLKAKSLVS